MDFHKEGTNDFKRVPVCFYIMLLVQFSFNAVEIALLYFYILHALRKYILFYCTDSTKYAVETYLFDHDDGFYGRHKIY